MDITNLDDVEDSIAPVQVRRKKSNARSIVIVVVVVLLALSAAAYMATASTWHGGGSTSNNSTAPGQHTLNIVSGVLTLGGTYSSDSSASYQIAVPLGATNAYVTGSWMESGGTDNIYVMIFNQTEYANWLNNLPPFSYYYHSPALTTETFSTNLPPGATYYMVYVNTSIGSEDVQSTVNLVYTS